MILMNHWVISLANQKKQKECASNINEPNHQNEIFRIAKQTVKERRDIMGSNSLKEVYMRKGLKIHGGVHGKADE